MGFIRYFLDCRPILEEYIASFPPGIAKAFGFDLDDLFGFESYSGMVYLYVSVLGAIMISSAAISVFAREKKEKCRDFLMTKPVRRGVAFGKKTALLPYIDRNCVRAVYGVVSLSRLRFPRSPCRYRNHVAECHELAADATVVDEHWDFYGGFLCARCVRLRAWAWALACLRFCSLRFFPLTEKEGLKYVSPLYYFSPNAVAKSGGYDPACVALAAVLFLTLLIASFVKYTREDLAA